MLLAIIGESCVGKSTLAAKLSKHLCAEVYTGRDYLRIAKNETIAQKLFQKKLLDAVTGDHLIYVISEMEHLELLPVGAIRILMTADLTLIQERFAKRMGGTLPIPVKQMLERKHGAFDMIEREYSIHNGIDSDQLCEILKKDKNACR